MASKNYFSHTDSLGRDPFTRMNAFGYSASAMGENIAAVDDGDGHLDAIARGGPQALAAYCFGSYPPSTSCCFRSADFPLRVS